MPRYYKDYPRGYDLDYELPFVEINGVRYQLGSAGSLILGCPKCGEEHFRQCGEEHFRTYHSPNEYCFTCHKQPMEPIALKDLTTKWDPLWIAKGSRIVSAAERRACRFRKEAERPWDWQFGERTEADFPLGFAKEQ